MSLTEVCALLTVVISLLALLVTVAKAHLMLAGRFLTRRAIKTKKIDRLCFPKPNGQSFLIH